MLHHILYPTTLFTVHNISALKIIPVKCTTFVMNHSAFKKKQLLLSHWLRTIGPSVQILSTHTVCIIIHMVVIIALRELHSYTLLGAE